MNDAPSVGVVDTLENGAEELEARRNVERTLVGEHIDPRTVDVFHDEIGQPLLGLPGVEQARHIGMVEVGENPNLIAESVLQAALDEGGRNDLERDVLLESAVGATPEQDDPHSTPTQLPRDLVGSETPTDPSIGGIARRCTSAGNTLLQELRGFVVGREEGLDFAAQFRVVTGFLVEEAPASIGSEFGRSAEEALDAHPAFGI